MIVVRTPQSNSSITNVEFLVSACYFSIQFVCKIPLYSLVYRSKYWVISTLKQARAYLEEMAARDINQYHCHSASS